MIGGYPGETESDFEEMKSWVKESRFDRLGIFAYSHEENTHAYLLDDNVSDEVKRERCAEIMAIQQVISSEKMKRRSAKHLKYFLTVKKADTLSEEQNSIHLKLIMKFYLRQKIIMYELVILQISELLMRVNSTYLEFQQNNSIN